MTKKLRRRISYLCKTPRVVVCNSIEGKVELFIEGEKLAVTAVLDEFGMREIAKAIRVAFKEIRRTRDWVNTDNFASLEESNG